MVSKRSGSPLHHHKKKRHNADIRDTPLPSSDPFDSNEDARNEMIVDSGNEDEDEISDQNGNGSAEEDESESTDEFWTEHDQIRFDNTNGYEYTLWRRAERVAKTTPFVFFPADAVLKPQAKSSELTDSNGEPVASPWSQKFCLALNRLISIPAVYQYPPLATRAIELARYYRLRHTKAAVSDPGLNISTGRDNQVMGRYRELQGSNSSVTLLRRVLAEVLEPDEPKHAKFLSYIKECSLPVRVAGHNGFIPQDVDAVVESWNKYADENPVELRSVDEYFKLTTSTSTALTEGHIRQLKKQHIIASRKEELEQDREP